MPYYDHFSQLEPTGLGRSLEGIQNNRLLCLIRSLNEKGRRLLEIGPGQGAFAEACRKAGLRYTAIEVNGGLATRLGTRGFEVVRARVPPLPVKPNHYDFVYCSHVIEHMRDVEHARQLLRSASRATRDGGLVCVAAPDILSFGVHFWDVDYTHSFVTSRRRLTQMFIDEDLDVLLRLYHAGPFSGAMARLTSWMAKLFPSQLIGAFVGSDAVSERLYRAKITFLGRIFIVGRKR